MAKQEKSSAELYREERKKRLAKAAKKNSKKSISSQSAAVAGKVITAIIILAILAGLGAVVVKQSGIIERTTTAITVDGEKVSQAEYGFYYAQNYNQYSQYAQYGYISLDTSKALSAQPYDGSMGQIEGFPEDQTPTWADLFDYMTKQSLKSLKITAKKAKEAGIELSDADKKTIEKTISSYEEEGEKNHFSVSALLKANFGKGMNEKLFRQILEEQQLGTAYQNKLIEDAEAKVTDKQIEKEYKEEITEFATVSVNSVTFTAAQKAATTEDGAETQETDKKSLANCKAAADKLSQATSVEAFDSLFKGLQKEYTEAKDTSITTSADVTVEEASQLSSDEGYTKWVSDANTKVGSTYVVKGDTDAVVFVMVNPLHKAPDTINYTSRHILIKFPEEETATETKDETVEKAEVEDAEDNAETKEVEIPKLDTSKADDVTIDTKVSAKKALNKEAYAKIQNVLQEYLNGDHTEEAFAALAEKFTEDEGSADNGGLYEDVALGNFVPPYEEWCTQEGRKEGDVGIVEYSNEGNYSGYHLIYFIGTKDVKWSDAVKTHIAESKVNEKLTADLEKIEIAAEDVNVKAVANAQAYLDSLIKKSAANASQQQYADYGY